MRAFLRRETYRPPAWACHLPQVPAERVVLGTLPTPMHPWHLPDLPSDVEVWVKRDDMSGNSLSGNKVRKLEFLLADGLAKGMDCVVTIGGIQSNHCRATAVAARYLGIDAHLVLRNSAARVDSDPGLVGNLLLDRLVGAHIHQVSKEEYTAHGSGKLTALVEADLRENGRKPYVIPVGGSNAIGIWGYVECLDEILRQQDPSRPFTDLVVASGSGATAGGLALGIALSGAEMKLHAYGVCDSPAYFYREVKQMYWEMGALPLLDGRPVEALFSALQAKGAGYAISQTPELEFIKRVGVKTGVVLDPVYSGKAVFGFVQDVLADPQEWKGRRVLCIHTGGLLFFAKGMYDKCDQLHPLLSDLGTSHRLQLC